MMEKLSLAILAGVGLFILVISGVLVLRGRTVPSDPSDRPLTKADFRIKEVHLQEEASGNVRWKLDADEAEVFERDGTTRLRRVTVTIEEPGRTWNVTGDEGELLESNKDVVIRKNVVLISSDGIRLETESLRWQAKEKRVWTDDPVILYRQGVIVRGQGLESRMADERTAVKGRVRATFTRARSGPLPSAVTGRGEPR